MNGDIYSDSFMTGENKDKGFSPLKLNMNVWKKNLIKE
jgi:hypothetical protein